MNRTTGTSLKKSRASSWGGALFGLLFFGVGAGFLLFGVIPNLWDAMWMRDWVVVPAEVVQLDLKSNHGDDTTTYKVIARFRYVYDGRSYTGDRVGIADGGSDNVGDWQHHTWSRLKGRKHTTLWVNPAKPSESVFDRDLRWGLLGFKMIFVIVFGGAGAVVLWFLNRKPAPVPPGLPAWQANADWHDNRIRSNAKASLWFAWGFAVFWNAISAPIPFFLPGELARGNQLIWIALLFPLVGLSLLIWAIRQTLAWRRFGVTRLQLDPFPGAIGGDVGGTVELRLPYNPRHRFRVTLTCLHVYTRRTGDGNETVRDAKWQDEQPAVVEPGMRGTRLRFLFQSPAELPDSSEEDSSRYEWTVQIKGRLPGADFDRSWKIPVFRDAGPHTARTPVRRREEDAGTLDEPGTVLIRETGAGIELYYPYFRHPGMALSVLIAGGIFAAPAWLIDAAAGNRGVPGPFLWLFSVIGALLLIWGIYLAGNSLRVSARREGLTAVRGILGLRFARHAAADDITGIGKSIGMQSRQGSRAQAYYRIHARTRDGRRIALGEGLTGASRVDALIERLRAALGLIGQANEPEAAGSRFGHTRLSASQVAAGSGQPRSKRQRWLLNAGAFALFLAFMIWKFRDVILI
jgi:hypothetical protein